MPYLWRIGPIICKSPWGLNGLQHGGSARTLFLPEENPDDFFVLLEDAFALYQPRIKRDADLVTDTAHARWFLLRRQRAYEHYEFALCVRKPDVSEWTAEEHRRLRLFDRYKIRAEHEFRRAMSNVELIRKSTGKRNRWRELHAREKERCGWRRDLSGMAA